MHDCDDDHGYDDHDLDHDLDDDERDHTREVLGILAGPAPGAEPLPYASSAEHLADHLERLDVLLWAASDPDAPPRELAVLSDVRNLHPELADEQQELHPARRRRLRRRLADELLRQIRAREAVSEVPLRAQLLQLANGLSQLELDALLLAATPRLDARFGPMWRQVEPFVGVPVVSGIVDVLARTPAERLEVERVFWENGRLLDYGLLRVGGPRVRLPSELAFEEPEVPLSTIGFLLGREVACGALTGFAELRQPRLRLEQLVLSEAVRTDALRAVRGYELLSERASDWGLGEARSARSATVLLVTGARGSGKASLAEALASERGFELASVDASRFAEMRDEPSELVGLALSVARNHCALLYVDEAELVFPRAAETATKLSSLRGDPFARFDGVVVLATSRPEHVDPAVLARVDRRLDLPLPTPAERLALWRRALPAALPLAHDVELEVLAERYALHGGAVHVAVLAAAQGALGRGAERVAMADLEVAAERALEVSAMAVSGSREARGG